MLLNIILYFSFISTVFKFYFLIDQECVYKNLSYWLNVSKKLLIKTIAQIKPR